MLIKTGGFLIAKGSRPARAARRPAGCLLLYMLFLLTHQFGLGTFFAFIQSEMP